jgi:hypothetical protein
MTYTNIARTGFKAFNQALAPLGVFSTDFSDDLAEQGTIVQTRIVPVASTAVSLSGATTEGGCGGDRSHSNAVGDTTTTAVTVTLNQDPIRGFYLTDEEAAAIGSGVRQDTENKLIAQTACSVANFICKYCLNLIIPASYTNTAIYTGAASAFYLDSVVDSGEALSQLGWDLNSPTYMVLDTAYLANLKKDHAVQDLSASGIQVVRDGSLPKLDVFSLLGAAVIRNATTFYDAANYGRGFACKPSAMGVAMRAVKPQAPERLEYFEVMKDPETGASLCYRVWYDPAKGKMYHTFEALFGATKGQVEALSLIKSQ